MLLLSRSHHTSLFAAEIELQNLSHVQPLGFPSGQILRNFGLLGILGRIGSIGGSSKMCIEIADSKWIPVMKCMRYS